MSITAQRSIAARLPHTASAGPRDDHRVSTGELQVLFDAPTRTVERTEASTRGAREGARARTLRPRSRPGTAPHPQGGAGRPVGTRCAAPVTPMQSVYLRRRRSAAALAAGVVLALSVWIVAILGGSYQDAVAPEPTGTTVVHVRGGESLGAVAQRVAPDMPTQLVIDEIIELNDLQSSGLRIGQPLLTPEYR